MFRAPKFFQGPLPEAELQGFHCEAWHAGLASIHNDLRSWFVQKLGNSSKRMEDLDWIADGMLQATLQGPGLRGLTKDFPKDGPSTAPELGTSSLNPWLVAHA